MGGEMKNLSKACLELEELYSGIPDDSVNLTFQDLADLKDNPSDKKHDKPNIPKPKPKPKSPSHSSASPLSKIPSLDFNKGIQAPSNHHHPFGHHYGHHPHSLENKDQILDHYSHGQYSTSVRTQSPARCIGGPDSHAQAISTPIGHVGFRHTPENSFMAHADASGISVTSMYQERKGRRRPGIPHSNICAICSTYIYMFRTRCLVCGRVYCRQCVEMGMGDMPEGRKCIECLGRRFSQRYIERAGEVNSCWWWSYPSRVKQAELKWAEKGPRRSGDKGLNGQRSGMVQVQSDSRAIRTSNPNYSDHASVEHSFVTPSSPYSPYSPRHLPL